MPLNWWKKKKIIVSSKYLDVFKLLHPYLKHTQILLVQEIASAVTVKRKNTLL